jgi:MFS family permease
MVALSFSYSWLVGWRFVAGLGASMYTTGVSVYLRDVATPESRGRFLSFQEMSILEGQSLGPLAGGLIGEYFGLRVPLFLQAALVLAALVMLTPWCQRARQKPGPSGVNHQESGQPRLPLREPCAGYCSVRVLFL